MGFESEPGSPDSEPRWSPEGNPEPEQKLPESEKPDSVEDEGFIPAEEYPGSNGSTEPKYENEPMPIEELPDWARAWAKNMAEATTRPESGEQKPENEPKSAEYEPTRFPELRAIAAIAGGLLAMEKNTGKGIMGFISGCAEKATKAYGAMEKFEGAVDEMKFGELSDRYENNIAQANNDEERARHRIELENMRKSREKKLSQEAKERERRNALFGAIGGIFNLAK